METTPSIQHSTFETYLNMIKEQSLNEEKLLEVILQILENINVNTFSEFMVLPEIAAVSSIISTVEKCSGICLLISDQIRIE